MLEHSARHYVFGALIFMIPAKIPASIDKLRSQHQITVAVLATALRADLRTAYRWVSGDFKREDGPVRVLLDLLCRSEEARKMVGLP